MDRRLLVFMLIIASGVILRLVLLHVPGAPVTDVYYYDSQAANYLAKGADPYGNVYQVPQNLATPGASQVFAYLPGTFMFLLPAWGLSDVRLGMLAADIVIAASLYLTGSKKALAASALFFLFPPDILFSTWFVNDSLPAIAFISAALLLDRRDRTGLAALCWGASFASSQEAWLVLPFYVLYCVRKRSYRPIITSVLMAFLISAPFVIWDYSAFINDTIIFQFSRTAFPVLSNGPFGLNVNPSFEGILATFGTSAPLLVRGAVALFVLVLIVWKSKDGQSTLALSGAAFGSAGLFLLSANLFWAYLELSLFLSLYWFALRVEVKRASHALNA